MINKTVVIFGVFDGIHDGHSSFIKEAKKQGNHLVAILARDEIVKELKNKLPKYSEIERINALLENEDIDLVLLGDLKIKTFNILKEVKPSVVYLGYDQQALFENLNKEIQEGKWGDMKVMQGKPYKPKIFHSSILNKNNNE